MMLVEQTQVPPANWPVAEFRDHLRLGTGFSDDTVQDAILDRLLKAAVAVIERRTGKALMRRSFLWTLTAWRGAQREELPVAPVNAITALRIIDPDGTIHVIPPESYRLEPDTHRPMLSARGLGLPVVPVSGRIEVDFDAGFGATWAEVPADLATAVFLLAAHYHETRVEAGEAMTSMPHGVEALVAPFRPIRLFGRRH